MSEENKAPQQVENKELDAATRNISRIMSQELAALLLDDNFILAFGQKLRKVMNGQPLYEATDLKVTFVEGPINSDTFSVYVEPEAHPTSPEKVSVFYQGHKEPTPIDPEFQDLILSAFKEAGLEHGRPHWAILVKNSLTEEGSNG